MNSVTHIPAKHTGEGACATRASNGASAKIDLLTPVHILKIINLTNFLGFNVNF